MSKAPQHEQRKGRTRKVFHRTHQTRRTRFPGILQAAHDLGVSRVHLYQVLSGRRKSGRLLARYTALKRITESGLSTQRRRERRDNAEKKRNA